MKLIEAWSHEEYLNYDVAKFAMDIASANVTRDAERHDLMIWKANRSGIYYWQTYLRKSKRELRAAQAWTLCGWRRCEPEGYA